MLTGRVRKNGGSLAVTIPKEEAERLDLHDGDLIVMQLNKAEVRPRLPADLQAIAEDALRDHAGDIEYLAER